MTENSHGQDLTGLAPSFRAQLSQFSKIMADEELAPLVGENVKKYFSSWDLLPIETW